MLEHASIIVVWSAADNLCGLTDDSIVAQFNVFISPCQDTRVTKLSNMVVMATLRPLSCNRWFNSLIEEEIIACHVECTCIQLLLSCAKVIMAFNRWFYLQSTKLNIGLAQMQRKHQYLDKIPDEYLWIAFPKEQVRQTSVVWFLQTLFEKLQQFEAKRD